MDISVQDAAGMDGGVGVESGEDEADRNGVVSRAARVQGCEIDGVAVDEGEDEHPTGRSSFTPDEVRHRPAAEPPQGGRLAQEELRAGCRVVDDLDHDGGPVLEGAVPQLAVPQHPDARHQPCGTDVIADRVPRDQARRRIRPAPTRSSLRVRATRTGKAASNVVTGSSPVLVQCSSTAPANVLGSRNSSRRAQASEERTWGGVRLPRRLTMTSHPSGS